LHCGARSDIIAADDWRSEPKEKLNMRVEELIKKCLSDTLRDVKAKHEVSELARQKRAEAGCVGRRNAASKERERMIMMLESLLGEVKELNATFGYVVNEPDGNQRFVYATREWGLEPVEEGEE
jgi:hypothetical protein